MVIQDRTDTHYVRNLWGVFFVLSGAGLITEHIWTWGEFTFFDFIGHEWLGVLFILIGIALNVSFRRKE